MADRRRFADLDYGQAGQLTYLPQSDPRDGPGELHTRRITADSPHLRIVGSSAELYPPSKARPPEAPSRLWQERQRQKRWLRKSHPEAFVGSSAFDEALRDDLQRFWKDEATPGCGALLATGPMTDVSDPSRVSATAVLASVTGQSGELLRLSKMQGSQWRWEQGQDLVLDLAVIDPEDRDDEVTWASDGLPICQIKFATSLSRHDPVRWLIVQKESSTVILEPKYHSVPVSQRQHEELYQQSPSRIDPNPLLALSYHQTGGSAHSDVAFNPGSRNQSPQLIVMDECGYWTVWNILGTRHVAKLTLRLSLCKCGHIWEGSLNQLPANPITPAERHGLLLVGHTGEDNSPDEQPAYVDTVAIQSQHLLLWNQERFEVFDTKRDSFVPRISNFVAGKARRDTILDVQPSPVNRNHVFALTSRHLLWVEVSCRPQEKKTTPAAPKVILACPLSPPARAGERMTTSRTLNDHETTVVLIYSPRARQVSAYWFTMPVENQLPQWHQQVMTVPEGEGNYTRQQLHRLKLHPAKLQVAGSSSKGGPRSTYQRAGVQFFQGNILGEDLSVRYCIFAACQDPALDITLPTAHIGWSRSEQKKSWKKKRRQFLRHAGNAFVLPDGMDTLDLETLVRPAAETPRPQHPREGEPPVKARPVQLKLERMILAISDFLDEAAHEDEVALSTTMLDAVKAALDRGVASGSLPLMTWEEAAAQDKMPSDLEGSGGDPEEAVRGLFDAASESIVVTPLRREPAPAASDQFINFASLKRYLAGIWLDPVADKLPQEHQLKRRAWMTELARDLFMSTRGVMVQDVPLLGPADPEAVADSQRAIPSSAAVPSPTPHGSLPSSPPATSSSSSPDAAFQRLQQLSPSLRPGHLGSGKQASVLGYWPTERGVDTSGYVSSVAAASDRQFDDARARLRRTEAKRRAQADKYRRPAFMRQGFPEEEARGEEPSSRTPLGPPQPLSSQAGPASSQSLGPPVTMSQPVAGAFGDRKKVKKGKRKSGFR